MLSHGETTENGQKSAQPSHNAITKGHGVRTIGRNAIETALDTLYPWSLDVCGRNGKPTYKGFQEAVRQLAAGRAGLRAIELWRKGHRGAPNWFRLLLLDKLRQRQAEIESAIQALEAMPERRGIGAGLRDWWRDKKARENAEQTAREREIERRKPLHRP